MAGRELNAVTHCMVSDELIKNGSGFIFWTYALNIEIF
jgi:hypothetical protein